jgi:hypothetical protein
MMMAGFAVILTLTTLTLTIPSYAAPKNVNNITAASLLSNCFLEDDSYDAVKDISEGYTGCCSKTLGYCVECPSSGRGKCIKYPRRKISTIRGHLAPNNNVIAPTKQTPVPYLKLKNESFKLRPGTVLK